VFLQVLSAENLEIAFEEMIEEADNEIRQKTLNTILSLRGITLNK